MLVPLGDAACLDDMVRRLTLEAERPAREPGTAPAELLSAWRRVGEELRARAWDPVASLVASARRVFVVPDSALQLVSFPALPVGRDAFLVETGPTIHVLSAERDLARRPPAGSASGLLAAGAPDFDIGGVVSSTVTLARLEPPGLLDRLMSLVPFRGDRAPCATFETLRFARLPAARREISSVAGLWRDLAPDASATELFGADATEGHVKATMPGHRVIHLATHGFRLGEACESDASPGATIAMNNPLLRSGIALAGANHRAQALPGEDDGILTTEEIAACDLRGCSWVVLSACEAASGDARSGEALLGLRRAFAVAGARTVIAPLWPVEDGSTADFIERLYGARLAGSHDTAEAMRRAMRGRLESLRDDGACTHPIYWGAFVAVGDWR